MKRNSGSGIYKLVMAFTTGAAISLIVEHLVHRYRYKSEVMKGIPESAINFHKKEKRRKKSHSHKWL